MFEKVSKYHPDKIADRIAGAIVDLGYSMDNNPKIACEVLVGHGKCFIINETSLKFSVNDIRSIVTRITEDPSIEVFYEEKQQDIKLAQNQQDETRCGDNGIFKGTPTNEEEKYLTDIIMELDQEIPTDGKAIIYNNDLTICKSCATTEQIIETLPDNYSRYNIKINPLGLWEGGLDVDTGATNRKLGSDMGRSVTGGGLHGKDLSKADVTLNICAFMWANRLKIDVDWGCSIGDNRLFEHPYELFVTAAKFYIKELGGFEKFAEYGLIR